MNALEQPMILNRPAQMDMIQRFVVAVGGPISEQLIPWTKVMEQVLIPGYDGRYVLSPRGQFAMWEDGTTTSSTGQEHHP